jgi:hypothetical protein
MWRLLPILALLHAVAHAAATAWMPSDQWTLPVSMIWGVAVAGYLGAAVGMSGAPLLRAHWRAVLVVASIASLVVLALVDRPLSGAGVAVGAVLLVASFGGAGLRIDERIAQRQNLAGPPWRRRVAWTLGGVAIAYVASVSVARPTFLRWGSDREERRSWLFGDSLVPVAHYRIDHGVTIHAPADSIWPWLVQLGQPRAGFYSHQWLERGVGVRITNADRIHPEWQQLEVGDSVFATQPGYLGLGRLGWRVSAMEPRRGFILDRWGAFVLLPVDSATTRFIVRTRGDGDAGLSALVFGPINAFVFEPAHFIMQRSMLLGVKRRAEGRNNRS